MLGKLLQAKKCKAKAVSTGREATNMLTYEQHHPSRRTSKHGSVFLKQKVQRLQVSREALLGLSYA